MYTDTPVYTDTLMRRAAATITERESTLKQAFPLSDVGNNASSGNPVELSKSEQPKRRNNLSRGQMGILKGWYQIRTLEDH